MSSARFASSNCRGFTLVETVLALALIAVSLAAIFALLSQAATTGSKSDRETMFVSMSNQILSDLRAAPFDNLWDADPHAKTATSSQPVVHTAAPADTVYYFTVEGVQPDQKTTLNTVYQCTVKKSTDTVTSGYASTETNLLNLHLIFQWPVLAPAANRQTMSMYATIARY